MIDSFFVYVHRKADTGEVFYVGKGSRKKKNPSERAFVTKKRSKFWSAIVERHGVAVEVVAWFEREEDAFEMERGLISHLGRRSDGGTLCNMTLGGEGQVGLQKSEETLKRLSDANSGERHHNWGKRLSAETCRRKSESMKASPKNLRGKKLPDWWREKIAATKRGADNPMHGKTGLLHHGSRAVLLHGYNMVFASIAEAADFAGMRMQNLHAQLTGITKVNKTNMELI